jgi:hypothetical protein
MVEYGFDKDLSDDEINLSETQGMIEVSQKFIVTSVVAMIANERRITTEAALNYFAKSKTFSLLVEGKAKLYTESPEYIYSLLKSEESNNIDEWKAE